MTSVPVKRIIITGGSGEAGRFVVRHLVDQGYQVLNLDLQPLPLDLRERVHTIKCDLTDSGQCFNALSTHFKLEQPYPGPPQLADAVIHFAGYPRNLIVPDNELFRTNMTSTYNVIEAACKLGIRKIVMASTICTYGVTYAEGDADYESYPVEETTATNPTDTYSISKVCCEEVARGMARRYGADIYCLRIGSVVSPEEHDDFFRKYTEQPEKWKIHGWAYIDSRDLAIMCELCVRKSGFGFQIFNATNYHSTNDVPTMELLQLHSPNIPVTRSLDPDEAPLSNKKIRMMLGFEEEHPWRNYFRPV